jgi:hypothetical protein
VANSEVSIDSAPETLQLDLQLPVIAAALYTGDYEPIEFIGADLAASEEEISALPPIDKPVVVIGENMPDRVLPTAQTLNDLGYDVHTWPAENFHSTPGNLDPRDIEANRSWLRYWTRQDATIVDLGIDPTRDPSVRSPFYAMEYRSIYENWVYPNVVRPK